MCPNMVGENKCPQSGGPAGNDLLQQESSGTGWRTPPLQPMLQK